MSRILLADDSPHAQRMGERILREEGFEVVSVTDGRTAMLRLKDVDPDVVFADVSLPGKSGYDMCAEIKSDPRRRHVRVVLTAGLLEDFDDARAAEVNSDGVLKKPFEASVVVALIKPMAEAAQRDREDNPAVQFETEDTSPAIASAAEGRSAAPPVEDRQIDPPHMHSVAEAVRARFAVERSAPRVLQPERTATPVRLVSPPPQLAESGERVDPERVRAAVTLALDAAMPAMIDKITEQVLIALGD